MDWFSAEQASVDAHTTRTPPPPIPRSLECSERWLPDDEDRWRAYLDTDSELVFYLRVCAEREFGNDWTESQANWLPSQPRARRRTPPLARSSPALAPITERLAPGY